MNEPKKFTFSDGLQIRTTQEKNQRFQEGDLVTIKIVSGEEILTRLEKITEDGYEVRKPLVMNLVQVPGSTTQAGVVFVPFLISGDERETVFLEKRNIIAITKPNKEAQRGYLKNTTGLDIPGDGLKNFDLSSLTKDFE